jgi:hypothetical protein
MNIQRPLFLAVGLSISILTSSPALAQSVGQVQNQLSSIKEASEKQTAASIKTMAAKDRAQEAKDDAELAKTVAAIENLRIYNIEAKYDEKKVPALRGKSYSEVDRIVSRWQYQAFKAPKDLMYRNRDVFLSIMEFSAAAQAHAKDLAELRDYETKVNSGHEDDKADLPALDNLKAHPALVKDTKFLIERTPSLEKCDLANEKIQQSIKNLEKTTAETRRQYEEQVLPLVEKLSISDGVTTQQLASIEFDILKQKKKDGDLKVLVTPIDSAKRLSDLIAELEKAKGLSDDTKEVLVQLSRLRPVITRMKEYSNQRDDLETHAKEVTECRGQIKDRNKALETVSTNPNSENFTALYEKSHEVYKNVHSDNRDAFKSVKK